MFVNKKVLKKALDSEEMNSDSTFKPVPPIFAQLTTLNAIIQAHVRRCCEQHHTIKLNMNLNIMLIVHFIQSFPVAFFLMTCKAKELYIEAFELVKTYSRDKFHGREPHPLRFMTDYELALMGAAHHCFPGCKIRGCWFHGNQANMSSVYMKIKETMIC